MSASRLLNWARDQFEVSRDARSNIRSMEGLRGFAVLLVFFAHYVTQVEPWIATGSVTWRIGDHLRSLGHIGVDLFFVLSGYLIYGALIRRARPVGDFLIKRAVRIYPTFLTVFGLYLLLSFVFPQESKLPAAPGETVVYLLQNLLFLPGMFSIEPVIVVAWSLSYEFFYYLAMPLLISALALREWSPTRRLGLFVSIAVVGFTWYFFTSGHVRLLMFVGGVVLYEMQAQSRITASRGSGAAALGAAIVLLVAIKEAGLPGWFRYTTLFISMSWLCLECFTVKGGTERLFSWTPLRWLGNVSYSYYLIHGLTLKAVFFVLPRVHAPTGREDLWFWALLPGVFAATVVVSAALFLCVEKPLSMPRATVGKPSSTPGESVWTRLLGATRWQILPRPAFAQRTGLGRHVTAVLVPLGVGLSFYALVAL